MLQDPFKEYIRQSEPDKREKGYAWQTAIGLQAVDGLETSKYLIDTAKLNIEGKITIDETQELLNSYYEENPKTDRSDRTEEADKVSARIVKILSEKAFSFTPNEYISIHRKLFAGIYGHAGKIRNFNITKKEWVLDGATVIYGSASELRATLEYDIANYNDIRRNVHETTEYMELFLRNLLLGELNELHNRTMHISGSFAVGEKADIGEEKADIDEEKAGIRSMLQEKLAGISDKTVRHVMVLFDEFGKEVYFGRSDVERVTGLKSTRASELLLFMLEHDITEPVQGHGKGKYRIL